MNKEIILEEVERDGERVIFKVAKQTHFYEEFADDAYKFYSTDGFALMSEPGYTLDVGASGIYLFNCEEDYDEDAKVMCREGVFDNRLAKAILQYNQFFGSAGRITPRGARDRNALFSDTCIQCDNERGEHSHLCSECRKRFS